MKEFEFVSHSEYREYPAEEMQRRAREFYADLSRRRTVREFSDRQIPDGVIENALLAAGTAPNGANLQPWHFAVVRDAQLKSRIREAAEAEEKEFYSSRAPQEWLDALAPLGTDESKPFLEAAPALIAIFGRSFEQLEDGRKVKHYYVQESVGIACGMLITALHHAGLATLTHTPSPMSFLGPLLGRPKNERPFLLLVAGYPAEDARIPVHALRKKSLEEIASFL